MLESSLEESFQNDRNMLSTICLEGIKHQKLTSQLEEAQKENKQLLSNHEQTYSRVHLILVLFQMLFNNNITEMIYLDRRRDLNWIYLLLFPPSVWFIYNTSKN